MAIGVDESIFSALVTGSDVARKKPFPDIYLKGAHRIGMAPQDCLVIEDAISGIQAAHAAGMDAVGVPTTFSQEVLQEKANPEYMLHKIRELTDLFN
jgi:beta-phosphoglucomutase-like phosphatase (HAD superfamily)